MKTIQKNKLSQFLISWLTKKNRESFIPLSNIQQIKEIIQPGDVLLIQGQNQMSEPIAYLSHSPWTHAALYIGKTSDITDSTLQAHIKQHYDGKDDDPLLVEGLIGKVTILSSLSDYQNYHVRLCRPMYLSQESRKQLLSYAISAVGYELSLWQLSNLVKWMLYWHILPHWLFAFFYKLNKNIQPKVCSPLLAEAFASIKYPISPNIMRDRQGKYHLLPKDPRLFAPKDFDDSPYFEIIKYPLFNIAPDKIYNSLD